MEEKTNYGKIIAITLAVITSSAAIAFVLNVPMKKIEGFLFPKANQKQEKYKRPVSLVLTLLLLILLRNRYYCTYYN